LRIAQAEGDRFAFAQVESDDFGAITRSTISRDIRRHLDEMPDVYRGELRERIEKLLVQMEAVSHPAWDGCSLEDAPLAPPFGHEALTPEEQKQMLSREEWEAKFGPDASYDSPD
jgi:hypothetical protein